MTAQPGFEPGQHPYYMTRNQMLSLGVDFNSPSLSGGYNISPELVRDYGPDFGLDHPGVISTFSDGGAWTIGGVDSPNITFSTDTPDSSPYSTGGCNFTSILNSLQEKRRKYTFSSALDLSQIDDNDAFFGVHAYISETDNGSASQNFGAIWMNLKDGSGGNRNFSIATGNLTPGFCFLGAPKSSWGAPLDWSDIISVEFMVNEAGTSDYAPINIDIHAIVGGMQLKMIFGWNFDDSNLGQYTNGFKAWDGAIKYSHELGVPVTVSCYTDNMDGGLQLNWEYARQMQAAGIGFAMHGGLNLSQQTPAAIAADLLNTQTRMIAEGIIKKNATKHMFLPNGGINGNVISAMQDAEIISARMVYGTNRGGTYPTDYWPTYQPPESPGVAGRFTCIQHTPPNPYFINSENFGDPIFPTTTEMIAVIDACIAAGGGMMTPYAHGLDVLGGTDIIKPADMKTVSDYVKTKIDSGDAIGLDTDDAYKMLWGYRG